MGSCLAWRGLTTLPSVCARWGLVSSTTRLEKAGILLPDLRQRGGRAEIVSTHRLPRYRRVWACCDRLHPPPPPLQPFAGRVVYWLEDIHESRSWQERARSATSHACTTIHEETERRGTTYEESGGQQSCLEMDARGAER